MDLVHSLRVFITVGELENFGRAAEKLDISAAAVSRAVIALESRLGTALILRTTRNVSLTEAGERYIEYAKNILETIEGAAQAIAKSHAIPQGNISVTAPTLFGKHFVMPTIMRYLEERSKVDISAYFNDRVVNLIDESIDVAVRIGHLPDSSFKAIRVGTVRRVLCASPEYLEKHGALAVPEDLLNHTVIAASGVTPRVEWKFSSKNAPTMLRITPRLTVTSNDIAIDAALGGLGIARVHSYQIMTPLREGKLLPVLEDFEQESLPIHILHRETKTSPTKVREFIDLLAHDLKAQAFI